MIILGIETSCDDTSIALVECRPPSFNFGEASRQNCQILSNLVSSQIKIHAPFGGIVPNLAARAHLKNIEPCLKEALRLGFGSPTPIGSWTPKSQIDLIAVTIGPGLIPSLLVGTNFAKALAYAWRKPILGINHIEGHIYANWLLPISKISNFQFLISKKIFPVLCLVVSGGHTQLILMKGHNNYKLLGQTRDDAAGEAFDKVAKLLNLGYPGGPIISQKAQKGNARSFKLPRPMINSQDFDFSFSGLKTAVLYLVKDALVVGTVPKGQSFKECFLGTVPKIQSLKDAVRGTVPINIPDLCASFQQAVIDVLIAKTIKAAKKFKVRTILVSGGVAANQELRQQIARAVEKELPKTKFQIPDSKLCTDNAAMIAAAAFYRTQPIQKQTWQQIQAQANLKLAA